MAATRDDNHATIAAPGLYPAISNADYHADPVAGGSLSSSGARALLPPSCPARYRHDRDHGQAPKDYFDFGQAAHRLVLGVGADIEVVDAHDWRTKDAKAARDEARAAGRTPLLQHEYAVVETMAAALRQHPVANALLDPAGGAAEQTLVWQDPRTDVWCRARLDWLPTPQPGRRVIIPDYKTCISADTEALRRAVAQFAYHQQADWYLDGARHVLGAGHDAAFVFIAQEKSAPYLVTIFELDHVALRLGAERNHVARCIYAECTRTGIWPPYAPDVLQLALPPWAEHQQGARS